jgi:glycosyltransferase involved in cell wall biosynthesis
VVTPCYNSTSTLRETIESVRSQDYPALEHIVMDGGSTDGTVDILKEYPHLIWVSEKDQGHYHAMNKGVERATGDVILILNADDCLLPDTLMKVGQAFVAHPEWDGLFGDIVYVDGKGEPIYTRKEAVFDYDVLRFSGVNYVIHQTLYVKTAVYQKLGGYLHQQYKNSCDYEFVLRLGKAGCRIGHIPAYLVRYRYHQHGQSADLRITRNMHRESAEILRSYGRPNGLAQPLLKFLTRAKRQLQKLLVRGHVDLVPGSWKIRKHMRERTQFSSNIGLDKL